MAKSQHNLSDHASKDIPDASAMKFGIVVAEWNAEITAALLQGCTGALKENGVKEENIKVVQVPGSFELPSGTQFMLEGSEAQAVICLGCIVKGDTKHNEYIANAVAPALVHLGLAYQKPVVFGVLTPENQQQALDRAGGKHGNKGVEAAVTAIKMVALKETAIKRKKVAGFAQ